MVPAAVLPASWYVDAGIFALELSRVFANAPTYIGCSSMVAEHGRYKTVSQFDHAMFLVRDGDSVRLLSNVCRHRSGLMLSGEGRRNIIVCPVHGWSYRLDGTLLKAPRYPVLPPCRLATRDVQAWNGILFTSPTNVASDLSLLGNRSDLDIASFVPVKSEEEEQNVNWKIPIELLLENYHAPLLHPGFARFVDSKTWFENEGAIDSEILMLQEMKPHPDFARNPASAAFDRWQRAILRIAGDRPLPFAALVALYLPNIILEWWPFMFVVTTYEPLAPDRTRMCRDFLFDPSAIEVMPQYAELACAAWYETQHADDLAHATIQRGRSLLCTAEPEALSGYSEFQDPMESSVQLFHQIMRDRCSQR